MEKNYFKRLSIESSHLRRGPYVHSPPLVLAAVDFSENQVFNIRLELIQL